MTTQPLESTATLFDRHLYDVIAHDLEGVILDYVEESVIFTP